MVCLAGLPALVVGCADDRGDPWGATTWPAPISDAGSPDAETPPHPRPTDATPTDSGPDVPADGIPADVSSDGDSEPPWPTGPIPPPWSVVWIGEPPAPAADAGADPDSAPPDTTEEDARDPADAPPDALADASSDLATDLPSDAPPEAATGLATDAPPDLAADSTPEDASEPGPEAGAAPDALADPDAEPEASPADDQAGRAIDWAQAHADGHRFGLRAGGSGVGVSAPADQFLFVQQRVRGDATLAAVVRSVADCPEGRVTFGVMIRASLAAGSPYTLAAVSGTPGAALQARRFADYFASTPRIDNGVGLPLWLRVSRQGSRVTAAYSRDGTAWRESTLELAGLGAEAHFGLVASSHGGARPCQARFDEVLVQF
jgi:hypothetical protein